MHFARGWGQTDVGRVRTNNQDSFLVANDIGIYMVADGMGGHTGGEVASSTCVSTIEGIIRARHALAEASENPQAFTTLMESAILQASLRIYEIGLELPYLRGMGTTATLAKVIGKHVVCAHVGDSRLYVWRRGFLYQITQDHTLVSQKVRAGLMTQDEAEKHRLRNVITRSVGYQEEETVDTYVTEIEDDDILLLSSDGLHGKLTPQLMATLLTQGSPAESVELLVDAANERGGDDNITAVVVSIHTEGKR